MNLSPELSLTLSLHSVPADKIAPMSLETQPKTPPKPKPPQQGISKQAESNPEGLRARMQELLRENWENCDPKYWQFEPDHRYRFPVHELEDMEGAEMTIQELEAFYEVYDLCGKKMKTANRLRIPYALAEWLIKQPERRAREDDKYEQWEAEEEEIGYIMAQLDED